MAEQKTTAKPKKPARRSYLGAAQAPVAPANNMTAEKGAQMTFIMPKEWHAEFKAAAAIEGISMKELLTQSFEAWKRQQG